MNDFILQNYCIRNQRRKYDERIARPRIYLTAKKTEEETAPATTIAMF